jgi:hypothetical protein
MRAAWPDQWSDSLPAYVVEDYLLVMEAEAHAAKAAEEGRTQPTQDLMQKDREG